MRPYAKLAAGSRGLLAFPGFENAALSVQRAANCGDWAVHIYCLQLVWRLTQSWLNTRLKVMRTLETLQRNPALPRGSVPEKKKMLNNLHS
jgi:hypothetical protein